MPRCVHQVAAERTTHPDSGHLEGHRLYGAPGEHEPHGHLHVSHVALSLGQEGQTLHAQTGSDITAALIQDYSDDIGGFFFPTLCGSCELKGLQSRK